MAVFGLSCYRMCADNDFFHTAYDATRPGSTAIRGTIGIRQPLLGSVYWLQTCTSAHLLSGRYHTYRYVNTSHQSEAVGRSNVSQESGDSGKGGALMRLCSAIAEHFTGRYTPTV